MANSVVTKPIARVLKSGLLICISALLKCSSVNCSGIASGKRQKPATDHITKPISDNNMKLITNVVSTTVIFCQ